MLAELAACNAALAVITKTLQHGKELTTAGKAVADFVINKDALATKATKKKHSIWTKIAPGGKEDMLQTFMALEEIKKQEDKLRETMQLYGRAGLYQDWVRFQAEARKSRQAAEKDRQLAIEHLKENIMIGGAAIAVLGIVLAIVVFIFNARGI
jgi:molecular chaperone GrpE (heat shock protein)